MCQGQGTQSPDDYGHSIYGQWSGDSNTGMCRSLGSTASGHQRPLSAPSTRTGRCRQCARVRSWGIPGHDVASQEGVRNPRTARRTESAGDAGNMKTLPWRVAVADVALRRTRCPPTRCPRPADSGWCAMAGSCVAQLNSVAAAVNTGQGPERQCCAAAQGPRPADSSTHGRRCPRVVEIVDVARVVASREVWFKGPTNRG